MDYKIVRNSRRKKIAIKISEENEIIVLVPKYTTKKYIEEIVNLNKTIIEKRLLEAKVSKEKGVLEKGYVFLLGEKIPIKLQYIYESNNRLKYTGNEIEVFIFNEEKSKETIIKNLLTEWYKKIGKAYLSKMFVEKAETLGFKFNDVRVKDVNTRWGSCSSKGNINLNYRLIMMPEEVINYVMIHELCHLREMNHSKNFWTLVETFDGEYKKHREFLRVNGSKCKIN
ncbi:M48 family metallopeptidase [Clostridium paridis]|uniref:M48 family metallopeptidase n=1 Tax=Clostridium paridis TaxID=2803863 RepID=A0A937FHA8_9CLOT|nr:SprT family zinc-dependent metalloprotease [Clostridium paridis]MBL4931416.1 M48 family metallopeptidase [Clostridium paridis]